MTLMMDAARVIEIRLRMMALGESAPNETVPMVMEKLNAMDEAKAIVIGMENFSTRLLLPRCEPEAY
jgi:hypothetical protein